MHRWEPGVLGGFLACLFSSISCLCILSCMHHAHSGSVLLYIVPFLHHI
jgi:hypothetical protein